MKMVLAGTGTSHGVPVIGCSCKVCRSQDSRDKRLRCSAWITGDVSVLVDVGPEFRIQALKFGIDSLDAVFITHSHADHLHGIDDLRVYSHTNAVDKFHPEITETEGAGLPIYANSWTYEDIKRRFDYIFTPVKEGGGKPKIQLLCADSYGEKNPLRIKGLEVMPVNLKHGSVDDMGLVFSRLVDGEKISVAYLTDCSFISDDSIEVIKRTAPNLRHLVIDGLRIEPHSTHFSFEQALEAAEKVRAKNVYLTHLTHLLSHVEIQEYVASVLHKFPVLEKNASDGFYVGPAHDGMELEF